MKNPYQKDTPSHSVWQNGYDCAIQNKRKRCPYETSWKNIWNDGWETGLAQRGNGIHTVKMKKEGNRK